MNRKHCDFQVSMACLPTEMDQFVPTEVNLSLIATGSKVLSYELPLNPITKEFGGKKTFSNV